MRDPVNRLTFKSQDHHQGSRHLTCVRMVTYVRLVNVVNLLTPANARTAAVSLSCKARLARS